jgi:hypothetical protein
MSATGPNRGSAAELLATGTLARAVIIEWDAAVAEATHQPAS